MYEQHFGLNKRPFRASATGNDVFVAPNIAATIAGIKKALSTSDAIVTISGAVGSGKSTLATHALESMSGDRVIVHVGRMRLACEDVLELLLDKLGIEEKPRGTIQRFAILRRKLKELEDNKTRVFLTIENSVRLGADVLAEIEALTSADAGESEGACVILMGDDSLKTLLEDPQLVRIQQRVRQRATVAPMCATELHEYLRHCFDLAGGDFEKIFETNAAQLLHYLSGGILRVNNNLVESAMVAAAEQNLDQVASTLLSQIAENDYDLSTDDFDLTPPIEQPQQEPETANKPAMKTVAELVATLPPVSEPSSLPEPPVELGTDDLLDEQDLPEFIQDTLPDLKILTPEFAEEPVTAPSEVAVEPEPEPVAEPIPEALAEPQPEPTPEAPVELELETESSGDDIPAWDLDPTMAELRPDLDALEQAMALAQGDSTEPAAEDDAPMPEPEPEPEALEIMPEITLDNAINERIENQQSAKSGEANLPASEGSPTDASNTETPAEAQAAQNQKSGETLQQMAVDLSKANSIDDIDDKLAETLFGDELNSIAAQFAIIPPSPEPANEDGEVVANEPVAEGVAAPVAATVNQPDNAVPAATPSSSQPTDIRTPAAPTKLDGNGSPVTSSQRLRTVRSLNADSKPAAADPGAAPRSHLPISDIPDSIEDQIKTSISDTQTQRVLNVIPPEDDDDQVEEKSKGGFFSRFRRS